MNDGLIIEYLSKYDDKLEKFSIKGLKYKYKLSPELQSTKISDPFIGESFYYVKIKYMYFNLSILAPESVYDDKDELRKQIQIIINAIDDRHGSNISKIINIFGLATLISVILYFILK